MHAASQSDPAAGWCVVGAGPSGLTALKNLRAAGIDAECLERGPGIGGNWHFGSATSRVFASTRLISSKTLTAYLDHPMPRDWPAYPDHRQCLDYLRGYADRFGLIPHVRTGVAVERIEPRAGGRGWRVHVAGGPARDYAGVVIASGHNHEPRWPAIPGEFSRPADLRNERLLKLGLPLWLRRFISLRAIDREIGLPWRHGLPRPDHRLWETHPIVNSELLARIAAGGIVPAADVSRFAGAEVEFADGRRATFDVVICATGYRTTFPFIDTRLLGAPAADETPRLFMHLLHPSRDDVAVVGLIQPDSGQWGLTDLQARLVARMAVAARSAPRAAAWLYAARQRPAATAPIRYLATPRHALEVEHFSYRHRLEQLIDAMDRRLRHDRVRGRHLSAAET